MIKEKKFTGSLLDYFHYKKPISFNTLYKRLLNDGFTGKSRELNVYLKVLRRYKEIIIVGDGFIKTNYIFKKGNSK